MEDKESNAEITVPKKLLKTASAPRATRSFNPPARILGLYPDDRVGYRSREIDGKASSISTQNDNAPSAVRTANAGASDCNMSRWASIIRESKVK